jgi:hypothetical protein
MGESNITNPVRECKRGITTRTRTPTSRQRTQAELQQRVGLISAAIVDVTPYVDTIDILTNEWFPFHRLRELCPGKVSYWPSQSSYRWRLSLQQPSREAIELLEAEVPNHIVSRLDVAFDLSLAPGIEAKALQQEIARLAIQPWHGQRKATKKRDEAGNVTFYMAANGGTSRNTANYIRSSKLTGEAEVIHMEFRYRKAQTCRDRGVETVMDLLEFNPSICLDRDLKLCMLDLKKSFKCVDRFDEEFPEFWVHLKHWKDIGQAPIQGWLEAAQWIRKLVVQVNGKSLCITVESLEWPSILRIGDGTGMYG